MQEEFQRLDRGKYINKSDSVRFPVQDKEADKAPEFVGLFIEMRCFKDQASRLVFPRWSGRAHDQYSLTIN